MLVTSLKNSKSIFCLASFFPSLAIGILLFGFPELASHPILEGLSFLEMLLLALFVIGFTVFAALFFTVSNLRLPSELTFILPVIAILFLTVPNDGYDYFFCTFPASFLEPNALTLYRVSAGALLLWIPYLSTLCGIRNIITGHFIEQSILHKALVFFRAGKKLKAKLLLELLIPFGAGIALLTVFQQYIAALCLGLLTALWLVMFFAPRSVANQISEIDRMVNSLSANGSCGDTSLSPNDVMHETAEKLTGISRAMAENLEKAIRSERLKTELVANVSHDLKTPLTAIIGYGEKLSALPLDGEAAETIRKLNNKSKYLSDLLLDVIELSKASTGNLTLQKQRLDLKKLVLQAAGEAYDTATEKGLRLVTAAEDVEMIAFLDGVTLHRVLQNLIDNALKYSMKGTGIYITVQKANDACRIEIVNTASYPMDFTPEDILERFARGDKARTSGGSGLGLSIAKLYTEANGGTLDLSIKGDQFTATLSFPLMKDI